LDLIERDSTILFDPSAEAAGERKAERPVSWPTRDVHEAEVPLCWLGQRGEIGIHGDRRAGRVRGPTMDI
jgi:hypothetical protein